MTDDPKPFQFSVRKLLMFVGVISVVCGVLFAVRAVNRVKRRNAWTKACGNRLKEYGWVSTVFYERNGRFSPPSHADAEGQPLQSWRVFLLRRQMRPQNLPFPYDFSLPWDHPKNVSACATMDFGWSYRCPFSQQAPKQGFTNYVMIVASKDSPNECPDVAVFAEIDDSDIHWSVPRDLNFEEMSAKINDHNKRKALDHHPHGVIAVYADGSSRFLDDLTDPEDLRKLLAGDHADAPGVKGQWHFRDYNFGLPIWEPD